jgi:hypothetical protein
MTAPRLITAIREPNPVAWAVVGCGLVRANPDQLKALRQNPPKHLAAGFFKHADDQIVAGVAAVFEAVKSAGMEETSFADWGVVAGACYLGRTVLAGALDRFRSAGAWSVSPHLIPNHMQHCLSGSVSIALKSHGLNVGVGGGPTTVSETFLAAASLAGDNRLGGLWIVLTGHAPEPFSQFANGTIAAPLCHALALAAVAVTPSSGVAQLRVMPAVRTSSNDTVEVRSNSLRVSDLTNSLAGLAGQSLRWQLDSGGWVEWQSDLARKETQKESQKCTAITPSGSPE